MKKQLYIFIGGWASTDRCWQPLIKGMQLEQNALIIPWQELLARTQPLPLPPDRQCFLIGWSMGGLLALKLIANRPALAVPPAGLVLIAATSCLTANPGYTGVEPAFIENMYKELKFAPETVLKQFAFRCFFPSHNQELRREFLGEAQTLTVGDLERGLHYLLTADMRSMLRDCTLPALIVHGHQDQIIPFIQARYLQQELGNAHLLELEQAGHALLCTHWEVISSPLKDFFNTYV